MNYDILYAQDFSLSIKTPLLKLITPSVVVKREEAVGAFFGTLAAKALAISEPDVFEQHLKFWEVMIVSHQHIDRFPLLLHLSQTLHQDTLRKLLFQYLDGLRMRYYQIPISHHEYEEIFISKTIYPQEFLSLQPSTLSHEMLCASSLLLSYLKFSLMLQYVDSLENNHGPLKNSEQLLQRAETIRNRLELLRKSDCPVWLLCRIFYFMELIKGILPYNKSMYLELPGFYTELSILVKASVEKYLKKQNQHPHLS